MFLHITKLFLSTWKYMWIWSAISPRGLTCWMICWVGMPAGADDPHTGREAGTNSGCTVVIRGWGLLAGGGLVDIRCGGPKWGMVWWGGGICVWTMTWWGGAPARVEPTEKEDKTIWFLQQQSFNILFGICYEQNSALIPILLFMPYVFSANSTLKSSIKSTQMNFWLNPNEN